jgi:hypothetical protein
MVNAWSLAYDVLNGTLDENFPIMTKDNKQKVPGRDVSDIAYGGLYPEQCSYYQPQAETLNISLNPDAKDTFTDSFDHMMEGMESGGFRDTPWVYESPDGGETVTRRRAGSLEKEVIQKPEPNLEYKSQKYEEDAGIKDLKDYISSTYSGHYTSEQNNTQTLDLIQSVGDAESFCRSNAIKYLARYDRKGQAKRDILKAMHYCLLLYYFSGHTNNETPTRGYETF